MKKLYKFLKSIKLAIVLISYITITSIIATLIPQGKEAAFYAQKYGIFLSWLILSTGFDNFFKAFIFIFPCFFFFINLCVCTVDRLVKECMGKIRKRFGPDIIHAGLLLLIIGSLFTFMLREEGFIYMEVGEAIKLQKKYKMYLVDCKYLVYPDGRPKDWISTVSVLDENDKELISSFPIEVNKPLNFKGITVYQSTYTREYRAHFRNANFKEISALINEKLIIENKSYHITDIRVSESGETGSILIDQYVGNTMEKRLILLPGQSIGDYTFTGITSRDVTGLRFVIDPGNILVMISLVIIFLGLFITIIQKKGDNII